MDFKAYFMLLVDDKKLPLEKQETVRGSVFKFKPDEYLNHVARKIAWFELF